MTVLNEQLLQQCTHRYRSLEVELNEAARSGAMSSLNYTKRLAVLQRVGQHLAALEISLLSAKASKTPASAIDLPIADQCSRVEQQIIQSALRESKRMVRLIRADSDKLMNYVGGAQMSDGNWFVVALRLSWMRARMSWVSRQLEGVRSMRSVLESFIAKIAPKRISDGKQSDLVDAFREFETTTSRIANLRIRLHSELTKNHDQEQWLAQYEHHRRTHATQVPPPPPADIIRARQTVGDRILSGAELARERLVIANKLVTTLDDGNETLPVSPAPRFKNKPVHRGSPSKGARK